MKTPLPADEAAAAYRCLLAEAYPAMTAQEAEPLCTPQQLRECWLRGRLGHSGDTRSHGAVRVLDYGEWNTREAGPAFRHAELELAGQRLCGDVQVDVCAADWEARGCSADPAYNGVVLHVVLREPPAAWYTRTADDREVPVLVLDTERAEQALGRLVRGAPCNLMGGEHPLAERERASIIPLLQSAAAHRCALKRRAFRERAEEVGTPQAWYEAWAETLGYGGNAVAMLQLARRVPLALLRENAARADALLMGAAGFLVPVMPERATESERCEHRRLWNEWWQSREQLSSDYPLNWATGPVRPLNHPHRRVAALARTAVHLLRCGQLCDAAHAEALVQALSEPAVPGFWENHYSLYAPALAHGVRLVGRSTAKAFLVNHVLPADESAEAWGLYLRLKAETVPGAVAHAARQLFGERPDIPLDGRHQGDLLRLHYAQQGLLQLAADFDLSA